MDLGSIACRMRRPACFGGNLRNFIQKLFASRFNFSFNAMKRPLAILLVLSFLMNSTEGQNAPDSTTPAAIQPNPSGNAPTSYQMGQQDGNSRIWQKIVQISDAQGNIVYQTNQAYVELATGLN